MTLRKARVTSSVPRFGRTRAALAFAGAVVLASGCKVDGHTAHNEANDTATSCVPPRILFVMDASSSMLEQVSDGGVKKTKWQGVQDAVSAVLGSYPDGAEYGLMTFPGPAGKCSTGTVLVDVAQGNAQAIEDAVAQQVIAKDNATPAGQSLVAASQYGLITDPGHKNYVVFLSDGWQYCWVPTQSAPACATTSDCSAMGLASCPSCNACEPGSSSLACQGANPDGCYCVRNWPVLGVQTLAAAGVTTFVVGFGSEVDALTLNQAAQAGGAALSGCDPQSDSPSCYLQATSPSDLTAAFSTIVQQVVSDPCEGPCGIPGTRTCTLDGWSACTAPDSVQCTSDCGTTGVQKCENGVLSACDAQCASGGGGAGGAGGTGGTGGIGGFGGFGGTVATTGGAGGVGGATGQGGAMTVSSSSGLSDGGTPSYASTGGSPEPSHPKSEPRGDRIGEEGSCACRAGAPEGRSAGRWSALAALALLRRRRRRLSSRPRSA